MLSDETVSALCQYFLMKRWSKGGKGFISYPAADMIAAIAVMFDLLV